MKPMAKALLRSPAEESRGSDTAEDETGAIGAGQANGGGAGAE